MAALRAELNGQAVQLAASQKRGLTLSAELDRANLTIKALEATSAQADAREAAIQQVLGENETRRHRDHELIRVSVSFN